MKPVSFKGQNIVFGEGQTDYRPLPALRMPDGEVITCWELTPDEIERVKETGQIYLSQLTFNKRLQPIMPMVELGDNLDLA